MNCSVIRRLNVRLSGAIVEQSSLDRMCEQDGSFLEEDNVDFMVRGAAMQRELYDVGPVPAFVSVRPWR